MLYFIYLAALFLFLIGLYIAIISSNYVRRFIGLGVLQNAIIIFYLSLGKVRNSVSPIQIHNLDISYTDPLPQVLMLTAIVVGFANFALALCIINKIYKYFNTISADELEHGCDSCG